MPYLETMRQRTEASFVELHRGVTELHYTQFPDHRNSGDSAIALGQARFWRAHDIAVRTTSSAGSMPERVRDSSIPVLIQGGGNLGGLYPVLSEARYELAERLPADTLLIQAPQSVVFPTDADRRAFSRRFAARPNLRVAVRDQTSYDLLRDEVEDLSLSPDAVHLLGPISAPEPTQRRIVIARTDDETAGGLAGSESADWPADPLDLRAHEWLGWRAAKHPELKPLMERDHATWMRRAERRFDAAVRLIARGEVVVTDRLHAMLIGLQMGRRVVALDNNNRKLSNYAETWFGDLQPRLRFEHTIRP
ncbi:polysaccharide pyruvyl transferase family protein [Plantibacter sp. VKM Ac-2876]|uniref:polysaccharide pyruvyl transferase family protein n=1 Tax=Plantibacter sp. VKM Ac-2876 TaxID=2783826 RepID=UPI00188A7030|nr:polysaccharide pyruvyl transferase family protein [Plantibacter sp. VKM Ac-2876]MBF4566963.1 polysaccharide pyruvyl transferase family protein [Plantibacter sp. VKM Ac-2876]